MYHITMTSQSHSKQLWIIDKERRAGALVERRNNFIVQLKQEGYTIEQIGALFNMHKTSVSRIARFGSNKLQIKK